MFRQCLSRAPEPQERDALAAAACDVRRLINDSSGGTEPKEDPQVLVLTAVARIIMNLDEFLTRD